MSAINGLDQFSGSLRKVTVAVAGPHVLITTEGSDGYGQALLTPEQARAFAGAILQEADSTAIGWAEAPAQGNIPG